MGRILTSVEDSACRKPPTQPRGPRDADVEVLVPDQWEVFVVETRIANVSGQGQHFLQVSC